MEFKYNDGGRSKYFKASNVGDCVTRAVAIATNLDYKEVYDTIKKLLKHTPRNGITKKETKVIMNHFSFTWYPTMKIGEGCTTHLREEELPSETIICQVTGHLTCVINGVINDTFDPSRNGSRCVYGYWYLEERDNKC